MIKEIIDNNIAYAKIIKAGYKTDKTEFFTKESDEIQFGVIHHKKDHKSGAHYHNRISNNSSQLDEIIILQEGSARIDFYNDKGEYIKSCEISKGDIAIIYKGGHNILHYEDTKMLTFKTGQYDVNSSKTRIIGTNNLELKIEKD